MLRHTNSLDLMVRRLSKGSIAVGNEPAQTHLSSFFFPSRLRDDTWVELLHFCSPLLKGGKPDLKLEHEIKQRLEILRSVEQYWGFPGKKNFAHLEKLFQEGWYQRFAILVNHISTAISDELHRQKRSHVFDIEQEWESGNATTQILQEDHAEQPSKGYFEVLIVGDDTGTLSKSPQSSLAQTLSDLARPSDSFVYEIVTVASLEDAVCAILFNAAIQAVVVRSNFSVNQAQQAEHHLPIHSSASPYLQKYCNGVFTEEELKALTKQEIITLHLARVVNEIRPELDIYCFSDLPVERVALTHNNQFNRVFYNESGDAQELHLCILQGVEDRNETPFFNALIQYSKNPMGVFHALPISRAASLIHSHWIKDMLTFYGRNIFLAETSATCGGLDSLLEPHGAIKAAQELAAKAFGSDRSFWVTNGTSTANKIVVQGLVRPGDIVLVDRNCHKSHHLGLALVGASVNYLEAYPLREYAIYGAVPLKSIKETLLKHKKAGTLHRVRMILLTNCTFDGIVYNVQRVMEECLAIKPDLVFLWDEAWWGFAYFHYLLRMRTAMHAARALKKRFTEISYRKQYESWVLEHEADEDKMFDPNKRWYPNPIKARVRVYATQSTHKTLTALRQGSMIHVQDQDFKRSVEKSFIESFYTHTSTSPNYQILASLDIGRRQVVLEGFELVQKHTEKALILRKQVADNPELNRFFHFLDVYELIPEEYRKESGLTSYVHITDTEESWVNMRKSWMEDEFVLDPNRLTLHTGMASVSGDTFKTHYLMDRFQIQVNKTSINSVLFMLTIGTSRSSVAYLLESLIKIGEMLQREREELSPTEMMLYKRRRHQLTADLPPLPNFSEFHPKFKTSLATDDGVLRIPFFAAYEEEDCDYIPLHDKSLDNVSQCDVPLVSANFVIPYPPGFPILVPGQVISQQTIDFFRHLDVKEIHGYTKELGLRIFKQEALEKLVVNHSM